MQQRACATGKPSSSSDCCQLLTRLAVCVYGHWRGIYKDVETTTCNTVPVQGCGIRRQRGTFQNGAVQCVCVFLCVCVCVKTGIVAHRVLHFHCWNWSEQEECSFKTLRVPFAIRKCKRRNTVGDCGCLENSRGALMLAVRAGFSTLALRGHSHWVGWGPWKLRSERIARVLCRIFIGETTDSGRANGLGSDVDETL